MTFNAPVAVSLIIFLQSGSDSDVFGQIRKVAPMPLCLDFFDQGLGEPIKFFLASGLWVETLINSPGWTSGILVDHSVLFFLCFGDCLLIRTFPLKADVSKISDCVFGPELEKINFIIPSSYYYFCTVFIKSYHYVEVA